MFCAMLGSSSSASATLVSAASARMVTCPGCAATVCARNCAAESSSGTPCGGAGVRFRAQAARACAAAAICEAGAEGATVLRALGLRDRTCLMRCRLLQD